MGGEVLTVWQRFHRETESIVVWSRLGPEYVTEGIRKAIRDSREPRTRFNVDQNLRRVIQGQ